MTRANRFKGLLFDFDETLVPEYDVARDILIELLAEVKTAHQLTAELDQVLWKTAGAHFETAAVRDAAAAALGRVPGEWYANELLWDDKSPLEGVAQHVNGFRLQVWTEMFRSVGFENTEVIERIAAEWPLQVSQRRGPYPESAEVLKELSKNHRMAIITNGEQLVQAMKVRNSGLEKYFDHVVLAEDYGGKPGPEPFLAAMEMIECEPYEVAMVGNNLDVDIAGARDLGIYSVWINRRDSGFASDVMPDATVTDLRQLLELL